ncbi:hypothetical protein P175DRAFT_0556420 [Aspergillus ochraceoroseus IBT 24754]|uniref:NmrA-like domain-containing protein n=1 Tax=Aspergillus ochraceoroseus IBT 24754 TaxID=1392256 RepID=A0A2T5LYT9_9EURO|nr:uncharacterized protein P175DRAFT_0556420 [Aspergillus ochraceoroseus IBT 24754]PTU21450.1 hypothetical protein P175DRAFT_0556420 [Aspergillus ochraceoroseus IBT 24754]
MAIVAVAGGSGDLGRTIVHALVEQGRHTVYILTRQRSSGKHETHKTDQTGASLVEIDYGNVAAISSQLQEHQIDTVISAINLFWPGASQAQLNLIQAAADSGVVTRFVPSEFNIDYNVPPEQMPYPPRESHLQARSLLEKTPSMAYTCIRNGLFMDYLGLPYAESYLLPLHILLDLPARKAVVPGDGSGIVVFTQTRDVARGVAALVDLPAGDWPREIAIRGERISLDGLVQLVERVTGSAFDVTHVSVEDLSRNITEELPSNRGVYHLFPQGKEDLNTVICTQMIGMAYGVFDIPGVDITQYVPSWAPERLGPFLETCWAKAK